MGDAGGGQAKGGKKRAKKGSSRVDMTPMVDLAFLLLTFFVMTSTFSKPKVMSLVYPAKPNPEEPKPKAVPINNAITFLLSKDKIFYYEGEYYSKDHVNPKTGGTTTLEETNFGPEGVRKLLAQKNSGILIEREKLKKQKTDKIITQEEYKEKLVQYKKEHLDAALKVLIKTDDQAICRNFIDLIDELHINEIPVIAPVDMLKSENDLLQAKIK